MKTTDAGYAAKMNRMKKEQSLHVITNLSNLLYREWDPKNERTNNKLGLSTEEEKSIRKKLMTYVNQL